MENTLDLQKLRDVSAFHSENRDHLIIIDEVQRVPEIFASLRGIIDKERRRGHKYGQFLFLSSVPWTYSGSPASRWPAGSPHLELQGVDVLEFGADTPEKLNQLWLRGGFPKACWPAAIRIA